MRLLSVNVAEPREVSFRGRTYPTAIFKEPVAGRVRVGRLNLAGDRQGNPRTHGGPDMAVYVYGHEHYDHWRRELGRADLAFGAFGENLTVEGLPEDEVAIGDVFRVGTARFQVTEPRTPCHKLAMRFDDPDLPRRFAASGRVGFYFRVLAEGTVGAGDGIAREARDPAGFTVAEALALWADRGAGEAALARALGVEALAASWRASFERRLAAARGRGDSAGRAERQEWDRERLAWS